MGYRFLFSSSTKQASKPPPFKPSRGRVREPPVPMPESKVFRKFERTDFPVRMINWLNVDYASPSALI
jgi:hypothetical protein